jgi:hypothetical protein
MIVRPIYGEAMIDDNRTAQGACNRIRREGGRLIVWAVLQEDSYETLFGDGFYLHVRGIALNEVDARRLADLPERDGYIRWHIRAYELGVKDGAPAFLAPLKPEEEIKIGDIVALLGEIAPGATASKLYTGMGAVGSEPFVSLPSSAPPAPTSAVRS